MEYTGERFIPEKCDMEMETEHLQRYEFARNMVSGMKVLDAACGEGYGSNLLSETASQVIGLDLDADTIAQAKEKYSKSNLSFVVGSIDNLPFEDQSFDAVVSFETLEHVNEEVQLSYLKEVKRILKANGLLIISTPNKAIYTDLVHGKNEFHIKELYFEEFKELVARYFRWTEIYSQYPATGYFITQECSNVKTILPAKAPEKSRYFIAICSNEQQRLNQDADMEQTFHFDDSMYYFLYQRVHDMEKEVVLLKKEADQFSARQETSIQNQKDYISHLEADLQKQKELIGQKDNLLNQQRAYITKKEQDIIEQKDYIQHLAADIKKQKKIIEELNLTINQQSKYIQIKECDINQQKDYIKHLEKDIEIQKKRLH